MFKKILISLATLSSLSFASDLVLNPEDYVLNKQLVQREGESNEMYQFAQFNIAQYKSGYAQGMICGNPKDIEVQEQCFDMYEKIENKKYTSLKNEKMTAFSYYYEYNLAFATKVSSSYLYSKANLEKLEKKYIPKSIPKEDIAFMRNSVKNIDSKAETIHTCLINYFNGTDPIKTSNETKQKSFLTCFN